MRLLPTLLFALGLAAQQQPAQFPPFPTVRANGAATVSLKPDQVRIEIGVTSQAATAQAAATANAKQVSDVITELKKTVGSQGEIQTANYSLHPNHSYPKERAPVITGYTATNTVRVISDDVENAGKLIDAATKVGANNIQGIHFTLKDESSAKAQALQQAAKVARSNAEAMASALGMKIQRVIRIEDGAPPTVFPVAREAMMMRADAASTPVESGSVRVQANVTVTAEVGR